MDNETLEFLDMALDVLMFGGALILLISCVAQALSVLQIFQNMSL